MNLDNGVVIAGKRRAEEGGGEYGGWQMVMNGEGDVTSGDEHEVQCR